MESELTGVILSAGKGSRIDPFNTHYPKPLLPIANKPIMGHHIDVFRSLGIKKVKIVVGHLMDKIINHFGRGSDYGVSIEYVEQAQVLGIAHAVGQLENTVDGPFLLVLGDIFYEPRNIASMIERFEAQNGGAVLAVMRDHLDNVRKNFSVELAEGDVVRRVIEKPRNPPNDLKGCGLYMFGTEIFDAVRKTPRTALRDEYEITSSIQILIDDGYPVSVADVVAWDYNITFPMDLLMGNLEYLKQREVDNVIADDAEIHPDADVRNCVIGPRARVTRPTKIRDSVLLADAVVDREESLTRVIISHEKSFQC